MAQYILYIYCVQDKNSQPADSSVWYSSIQQFEQIIIIMGN